MKVVKQTQKKAARLLGVVAVLFMVFSCTKEDPVYSDPTISFADGDYIEVKRGEAIVVNFNLNAEGGNKELLVYRDGGLLERVALNSTATTYTYNSQVVPATAAEGEEFEYEFALLNTQDVQSGRLALTVSTIAYDAVTIGDQSVYEVDIPADGSVESGVSLKFVTGRKYSIGETLFFQSGAELIIEEGVEIYFKEDVSIDLTAGSNVEITGTASAPVVLTSEKVLTGGAAPGDWGTFNIRGNEGVVHYLRLEYGTARSFRLNGAGVGIDIAYVQAYKADGEGIMMTNGDANAKYLVATDCIGGGFRIGDDYTGNIQFAISTTSIAGEQDEFTVRETAAPRIANVTVLGPGTTVTNTHGIRLRAASAAKIYNAVVAEFPRRGLRLNDDIVITDLNGPTVFAYSYIFNVPTDPYRDDTDHGNPFRGSLDANGDLQNPFFNNVTGFDGSRPILSDIAGIGVGDFVPAATQTSAFNPTTLGSFFSSAAFVGAIQNAENDWTRGWVKNSDGSIR